jgi:hypothetical protein
MGEIVPANHIRECIAAMDLRVKRIMTLKKISICKCDRLKIFLTKRHVLLLQVMGCPFHVRKADSGEFFQLGPDNKAS